MAPSPRPELDASTAEVTPQNSRYERPSAGDEVVISGLSGKFPDSDTVRDFCENLYNKTDMVSGDDRRWNLDHPEIPQRTGKINDFDKFDAQFFGVHYKQAWVMEPMCRMLQEHAYAAIFDAGINPRQLRNSKTGVFIGSTFSETEKTWFYERVQNNGFGITGCSRAMYANRISYWLGTTGPSYTVDSACASSMQALEHGYKAIRSGQCDAAIVGGVNLCLQPHVSLQFNRLGFISLDGKTKSFDKNANGYARAETNAVVFLQRAKDAKRVYAEVAYVMSNVEGYQCQETPYRTADCLQRFLGEFYQDTGVSPKEVEFVEAYGSGLPKSDREELIAIDHVFCKDRDTPVLVGSVKSNMGHSDPASGINSITKVCLAYHRGAIAPNLHYTEPRDDVAGVREGRVQVVTEPTPFSGGYTAASCYSYSGVNVHALFKGFPRKKLNQLQDDLPRLVTSSGRTMSSVERIFKELQSGPLNVEQIGLLHNIFAQDVPGHVVRGYQLLAPKEGESKATCIAENIDYFQDSKRPVWFVYSGMGSQWSGMGTQLMRIPIFAAAIERCCRALAPKGVDLLDIITNPDPSMYDNILHSFVGIAAVQIGLTDVLTALGIQPDNIIGHSVGELGCAYADGCFTAEEMILAAYSRGLVSVQTPFIRGSMAAVGRGYQEMKARCPLEIEVACHNGPDSCTISGPADVMKDFVAQLTAEGVFAKEVPCSNIAYHSKYIAEAGPNLLKYLREVIPDPKPRSARWLSTSVPQARWTEPAAQLSSPEYHTNNLLSAVLFEETSRKIPANAITIEVAPHGLLQAILRRSLASDTINVPLTKRGHRDNVEYFLSAIGKLYQAGMNPKLANIYPAIQFPVSVDAPMLSHLVEWEHSEDWTKLLFKYPVFTKAGEREITISIADHENKFMVGNVINGRNMLPESSYLVLVWETLGMMLETHHTDLSVVFERVRFHGDLVIYKNKTLEFTIMLQKGSGNFEIIADENLIVTGRIYAEKSSKLKQQKLDEPTEEADDISVLESDVYRILATKGYSYSGIFRGIHKMDTNFKRADLKWNNNWVSFLDSILQVNALKSDVDGVLKPKEILKLCINVDEHKEIIKELPEEGLPCLPCVIYEDHDVTRCGGVDLSGLRSVRRLKPYSPPTDLFSYQFIPNINDSILNVKDAARTHVQLALQNSVQKHFHFLELSDKRTDPLSPLVSYLLKESPHAVKETSVKVMKENSSLSIAEAKNAELVIVNNLGINAPVLQQLHESLEINGLVLSREQKIPDEKILGDKFYIVAVTKTKSEHLVLMKKRHSESSKKRTKYITVKSNTKFPWVDLVQAEWASCDKLVLVSECDPCSGLLGMFNCLRKEPGGHVLSLLVIEDYSAPAFRPDLSLYKDQLDKNMPLNVYKNSEWGSYQYMPMQPVSVQSEHAYLASQRPGDISSLTWLEGPLTLASKPIDRSKKLVQVYYSAVSHRDSRKATGPDDEHNGYGMDFCGRTTTGERVMGLLPTGALSSLVEADVDLLWPVPPHWSMEDAVTVPLAYANAFYCLFVRANLRPGHAVLIHSGAGALGQAAISICLAYGCDVYATVGSLQKKSWLLKMFPELKETNVSNSKNDSFEEMVELGTKGKGCDIIINTQPGTLRDTTQRILAWSGTILNLNMDDIEENNTFGMFILQYEKNYSVASVSNIFKSINFNTKKVIHQLVADGLAKGFVQPLSRLVFSKDETCRAFRFMINSCHIGKVVLKIRDEEVRPLVTPSHTLFAAHPRFICKEEANYVVIADADQSGFQLADWLVQRGAKNILLHAKKPIYNGYQTARIQSWKRRGVSVVLSSENLQTDSGCLKLITEANKQGPVLGVFIAPHTTERRLFENAEPEHFAEYFATKALVVMNLDCATRKLCSQLKDFVVLSSSAAGRGVAGYSIGSLADSVVERISEERGKIGLPALALQLEDVNGERQRHANYTAENDAFVTAISKIDVLLKSNCRVALSVKSSKPAQNRTIIEAVAELLGGFRHLVDVRDDLMLNTIGVNKQMAEEIQNLLEREFNVFITAEKILKLTFHKLKNMQPELDAPKKLVSGLDAFFSYIEPEEFNAAEELVGMATAISCGTEGEVEFNKEDQYVFLVPSMEGHKHVFPTVAQRLKTKAMSCQHGLDHPNETIPDVASRLCKVLKKKLLPNSTFYLLGYGFGVSVALEMAAILESLGHVGKVFCLDGGPAWFSALLDAHLGHLSEPRLRDELIRHMFRVMCGDTAEVAAPALLRALAAESDWERKLDVCMRHLRGRVPFSFQYQRSLVAMAYARIRQARAYSDARLRAHPLRSELVLLKATRAPKAATAAVPADYGLAAYSQRPLAVYELDCDHAAAPTDLNVSDILNRHVADMERFKKLNLCQRYSANRCTVLL